MIVALVPENIPVSALNATGVSFDYEPWQAASDQE
jgi:hypothetical protein